MAAPTGRPAPGNRPRPGLPPKSPAAKSSSAGQQVPAPAPAPAPATPGAPAGGEPDELALQVTESPPERHEPGRRFRRQPTPVSGKPTDIGDSGSLLMYAGLVCVAVVLISAYYIFVVQERPANQEGAGKGSAASGSANSPGGAGAPASGSTSKVEPAPGFDLKNPANRGAYHAYLKFLNWAYDAGLLLPGDQLTAKFKSEVSLQGVDDPDVRALHAKALELFALPFSAPLMAPVMTEGTTGAADGRNRKAQAEAVRQHGLISLRMKELANRAEKRYGHPAPPAPPPTAARPNPPAPAPSSTSPPLLVPDPQRSFDK